eukprot:6362925-Prorocentrum_lima.AAC.1
MPAISSIQHVMARAHWWCAVGWSRCHAARCCSQWARVFCPVWLHDVWQSQRIAAAAASAAGSAVGPG